jgi:hypothetical protein
MCLMSWSHEAHRTGHRVQIIICHDAMVIKHTALTAIELGFWHLKMCCACPCICPGPFHLYRSPRTYEHLGMNDMRACKHHMP